LGYQIEVICGELVQIREGCPHGIFGPQFDLIWRRIEEEIHQIRRAAAGICFGLQFGLYKKFWEGKLANG